MKAICRRVGSLCFALVLRGKRYFRPYWFQVPVIAIAPAKFWEHRMLKASGGQSKFPTLLGKRSDCCARM